MRWSDQLLKKFWVITIFIIPGQFLLVRGYLVFVTLARPELAMTNTRVKLYPVFIEHPKWFWAWTGAIMLIFGQFALWWVPPHADYILLAVMSLRSTHKANEQSRFGIWWKEVTCFLQKEITASMMNNTWQKWYLLWVLPLLNFWKGVKDAYSFGMRKVWCWSLTTG